MIKHSARQLLENRIGRRTFVGRLTRLGMALPAARALAAGLLAQTSQEPSSNRVLSNLTGGEVMAEFLLEWNVPYIFGLGGSEEVGFLDALVDRSSLKYVQALHEAQVMSMADGYARASSTPAFVNLHSIAGAGYALAPMVNAFKDRIPLVVTVGRQSTTLRGSQAFLEAVNLHRLPADYTRWSWDVSDSRTIPEVLRRAFMLAQLPPSGPTFVTFSKNLWEEPVERAEILPRSRSLDGSIRTVPARDLVRQAADLILKSRSPIFAAGRELSRYGGVDTLMEIADLVGAPVFQDIRPAHAPLVVPTAHPHFCGVFGVDPAPGGEPDLYLAAGAIVFSEMEDLPSPRLPPACRVIQVGFDGAETGRNQPVDVPLVSNVRGGLEALLEEIRSRKVTTTEVAERREQVRRLAQARRDGLLREAERRWNQRPIASQRLAFEINRKLDADAIVVSELVTSEPYLASYLDIAHDSEKRRLNLTSSGGVLGWGAAAAIGAKIAQPDRQVVSLLGDGSFQFGMQALWSAARYEVPVGFVLWNNRGYQANRRALHEYRGRAAATGKYIGASLYPDVNPVLLARGMGVEGERVEAPDQLPAGLDRMLRALEDGRPYLLDVQIARQFGGADSTYYDHFSVARSREI